jgi:hypothetical protein
MGLTETLFTVLERDSSRDLILLSGTFLVAGPSHDARQAEGPDARTRPGSRGRRQSARCWRGSSAGPGVLARLVITAVMASELWVMVTTMILSVAVMLIFAGKIRTSWIGIRR